MPFISCDAIHEFRRFDATMCTLCARVCVCSNEIFLGIVVAVIFVCLFSRMDFSLYTDHRPNQTTHAPHKPNSNALYVNLSQINLSNLYVKSIRQTGERKKKQLNHNGRVTGEQAFS